MTLWLVCFGLLCCSLVLFCLLSVFYTWYTLLAELGNNYISRQNNAAFEFDGHENNLCKT